jgi:hypothetical protein
MHDVKYIRRKLARRDFQSRETDAGEKIADRKTNTFHIFFSLSFTTKTSLFFRLRNKFKNPSQLLIFMTKIPIQSISSNFSSYFHNDSKATSIRIWPYCIVSNVLTLWS